MTKAIVVRIEGDYVITAQGADLLSTLASQASDARDEAVSAAAAALAAGGVGEYPDTGAGLSGTTEGETFWVDLGDGTGQVYRHDPGPTATPLHKFIIDPTDSGAADIFAGGVPTTAALASSSGGDMVGFKQDGASAVDRTLLAKARETLSVEDFYDPGDTDSQAWQKALNRLNDLGGGTLIASRPSYDLDTELVFSGLGLVRAVTIDARGAIFTTGAGVNGVMSIVGNSYSCGVAINNFIVDHTANDSAIYGFRQAGTANVSWPGCFVRGGGDHPPEYAAWLLQQIDPDNNATACFWTMFGGARCHGEINPIPNGVVLEGSANATDFHGFDCRSCINHIVLRYPAESTLPDDEKGTPNGVRVVGGFFEGGTNGVLFQGVPGSYGPYGLLVDSRFEAITNMVNLQGATKNYRQPGAVIVSMALQSVTNILVNPNGLQFQTLDLRSLSGSTELFTRGWKLRSTDTEADLLELALAGTGHGVRLTLSEDILATLRYAASGVVEFAGGSGSIGIAYTRTRALSGTGTRGRNFSGYVNLSSEATKVVDLIYTEPDNEYGVFLDVPVHVDWWVSGKTTTQFTINLSAPISGAVRWMMFR